MNDARTNRKPDSAGSPRAGRGMAAVVAQYIHERSGRHDASRRAVGRPEALGQGADTAHPREAATEAVGGPRP